MYITEGEGFTTGVVLSYTWYIPDDCLGDDAVHVNGNITKLLQKDVQLKADNETQVMPKLKYLERFW